MNNFIISLKLKKNGINVNCPNLTNGDVPEFAQIIMKHFIKFRQFMEVFVFNILIYSDNKKDILAAL